MKQFYAYLHENGSIHIRQDMGATDTGLLDAESSPHVIATTSMYFAANNDSARRVAIEKLWDDIERIRKRQIVDVEVFTRKLLDDFKLDTERSLHIKDKKILGLSNEIEKLIGSYALILYTVVFQIVWLIAISIIIILK
tara:strand:- start:5079 stop:5495 length:417 start_codon:yes stop_codon:yes gene_type:complete